MTNHQYRVWSDFTDVQTGQALYWWQRLVTFSYSRERVTHVAAAGDGHVNIALVMPPIEEEGVYCFVMHPFEEEAVYCFANVGRSVGMSVGR